MEFKKIDDKKFQCLLFEEDLEENNISLDDFFRNDTEKIHGLLDVVMEEARKEIGIAPSGEMISLQLASVIKSFTVNPLNLTGCWNAKLTPLFALSVIDKSVISSPSRIIFPDVGFSIPAIIFASVDLPPPLGPVIATKRSSIFKLIFFKISFSFESCLTLKHISFNSSIFSSILFINYPALQYFLVILIALSAIIL